MPAVPKPLKRTAAEKVTAMVQKLRARQYRNRASAIARAKGKPRTAVKKRNEPRIKRKATSYRKVIASDFHKRLRYDAYLRSGGLCECEQCVRTRRETSSSDPWVFGSPVATARDFIPIWFTKKGTDGYKRFRSTDGELHHTTYKHFGDENPAELQHVQWVWKSCHQRIESEHGTRRRFLKGSK